MSTESLRKEWTNLYRTKLPALAKKKSSVQPKWPVHLDHCFARIILDNAVGRNSPWMKVVKSPAVKNMDVNQLKDAIELGTKIAEGRASIAELNDRSLDMRGKSRGKTKGNVQVKGIESSGNVEFVKGVIGTTKKEEDDAYCEG